MVERAARFYTPCVLVLALLVALLHTFLLAKTWPARRSYLLLACNLLVAGCPCALVLSTPATVVSGIASLARGGVLVKGGVHLERLGRVMAIGMDKTGTLTEGRLSVERILSANWCSDRHFLFHLASLESQSSHPIAGAVLRLAEERNIEASADVVSYKTIPGAGASAVVEGRFVVVGRA